MGIVSKQNEGHYTDSPTGCITCKIRAKLAAPFVAAKLNGDNNGIATESPPLFGCPTCSNGMKTTFNGRVIDCMPRKQKSLYSNQRAHSPSDENGTDQIRAALGVVSDLVQAEVNTLASLRRSQIELGEYRRANASLLQSDRKRTKALQKLQRQVASEKAKNEALSKSLQEMKKDRDTAYKTIDQEKELRNKAREAKRLRVLDLTNKNKDLQLKLGKLEERFGLNDVPSLSTRAVQTIQDTTVLYEAPSKYDELREQLRSERKKRQSEWDASQQQVNDLTHRLRQLLLERDEALALARDLSQLRHEDGYRQQPQINASSMPSIASTQGMEDMLKNNQNLPMESSVDHIIQESLRVRNQFSVQVEALHDGLDRGDLCDKS